MSSSNPLFSLHCIICYEAFDRTERPPVVLPCGHTYLCQPCSRRLTKCMECRQPLFCSEKHESPLPMPKNLVLLCMLEDATAAVPYDVHDESDDAKRDEASAMRGNVVNHTTGTFAVCEPSGLKIHASLYDDEKEDRNYNVLEDKENNEENKENDDDQYSSNVVHVVVACASVDSTEEPTEVHLGKDRNVLGYGQTVQVVSFDGQVAVLARGQGYVYATPSQLVKVGDAKDEGCRIEGMILSLEREEEHLRREMEEIDSRISSLSKRYKEAVKTPFVDQETIVLPPSSPLLQYPVKPHAQQQASRQTSPLQHTLAIPHNMSSWLAGEDVLITSPSSQHSSSSIAAATPRSRLATKTSGQIDFRTGMSGHLALASNRRKPQQVESIYTRGVRMMGEHRGIARIGSFRK